MRLSRWQCFFVGFVWLLWLAPLAAETSVAAETIRVAVAKAAMETGLVQALAQNFESSHPGTRIKFESVGAIQALDSARKGRADVTITHHPPEEKRLVSQGIAVNRSNIMYSEYALFGPAEALSDVSSAKDIVGLLRSLAEQEVAFLEPSPRGGTYRKIRELWVAAGVNPDWLGYENTGTSALAALRQAADLDAFTMAEVGTYRQHRDELNIALLYRDDLTLRNVYSAMVVNAEKIAGVNQSAAQAFVDYLVSPAAQSFIQKFNKDIFGVAILSPAAHLDAGLLQRRAAADLKKKQENVRVLIGLSAGLTAVLILSIVLFVRVRRADRRHLEMQHRTILDQEAREMAERSNRIKSEFLATMSHEVRTPLTAIIGYSELLSDALDGDKEQKENADIITKSGTHLLQIISDILDLSKIEAEKLEVGRDRVDVLGVLSEVADLVKTQTDKKGITFAINFSTSIPKNIESDGLRLKQIILNLCSNAVKFTDSGSIAVDVSYDAQLREMIFKVRDTGIGIKEDALHDIFEAFTQADSSATRRYGGTGLGLSLSRRLAERLGGYITAMSQIGKGSCFTVTIDAGELAKTEALTQPPSIMAPAIIKTDRVTVPRVAMASAAPPPPNETAVNGHVLLAEDVPENQRLVELFLRPMGVKVHVVENGQLALQATEETVFDVILMDMKMPIMGGLEAVQLLRKKGYSAPIVALTANAMAEDKSNCLAAGCDEFLAKPVNRTKLLNVLGQYIKPADGQASPQKIDKVVVPITVPIKTNKEHDVIIPDLPADMADDPDYLFLVGQFVERLPQAMDDIKKVLTSEDWESLTQLMHNLKGSAGGFGFPGLTDKAEKIHLLLRENVTEEVQTLTEQLMEYCQRIKVSA
jgi:signal transduction histidine kinase/FixJ family two-component response regulator/HPt (histidine-containing phosphotransfer) domain-containing protein